MRPAQPLQDPIVIEISGQLANGSSTTTPGQPVAPLLSLGADDAIRTSASDHATSPVQLFSAIPLPSLVPAEQQDPQPRAIENESVSWEDDQSHILDNGTKQNGKIDGHAGP